MKILFSLLVLLAGSPAAAQHAGHQSSPEETMASCPPEHAAMGHCTPALPEPPPQPAAPARQPTESCPPEHAAMGHCTPKETEPSTASPPAVALSGPENAADAVYGAGAMASARKAMLREHGDVPAHKLLIDRAEIRSRQGEDSYLVDTQAWYGGDIDKLWLKSEIEGGFNGGLDSAEVQALWSHAIGPWFDLQAGVRQDAGPGRDRTHFALGVQGLAPYWWETDAALFVSTKGEVTARLEAEHDARITQKLILQPRAEVGFSFQDTPELMAGAGITDASLGARLRYQIASTFSPYLGVEYERAFAGTARYRRLEGERAGGWNFLVGLRTWF
ncbi:copper resistance protein B [Tsuneonella deserti]|uniref:Copper resistance protein B n=1 Tax=Tsuneonella deserti TaxID=2035528 RepID=A0ABQ1S8B5_9SPHN|nr:copper resistance protein B [Tsuneonella deserti]GGD99411.1 copper resistance protein B [Tsuneonella deserti]